MVNCSWSLATISVGPTTIESPTYQSSALITLIEVDGLVADFQSLVQTFFNGFPYNYKDPVTPIALLAGSTKSSITKYSLSLPPVKRIFNFLENGLSALPALKTPPLIQIHFALSTNSSTLAVSSK